MKLAAIIVFGVLFFSAALAFGNRKQKHAISTEIVINAPAAVVWKVLTDGSNLSWNPFMSKLEGDLVVGNQLEVELGLEKKMTFKPTVLVATPERELRWLGRVVAHGFFDGEHVFELSEQADGKTRLHHYENFEGFLVPLLARKLNAETTPGFEAMNRALKARAEAEVHS